MKSLIALSFAVALSGATSLLAKEPAAVRVRIEADRAVLPADTPQHRAIIKVGLDCFRPPRAGERPRVNLALVIDRSGSMQGDKIERAREAALELVRQLAPDDIVSLIAYDSSVDVLVPAQPVGNGRALAAAIRSIEANGNTALHGGVSRGATEIRRHLRESRAVPRLILLSDGQANVGPSSPEELGRLGASLLKEGISVTTIGLGLGFNEDLMTRLAARSDGNTYFVESSDDLPRIFAAELGDTLSVVARRVVIEIEFPQGVRPVRFVGREGTIREQRAELTLNQLYGGQEKFALVEVELDSAAAGSERELARAHVRFEDVRTAQVAEARSECRVKFSADAKVVVASANARVQVDYATNSIAEAKEAAIALVDAGRRDEAGQAIRARAAELASMAKQYSNALLDERAAAASAEAARVERDGLSNAARKTMRAETHQAKNQQNSSSYSRP